MSDDQKTEVYTGDSWHAPVKTKEDLPKAEDASEGMMCYVLENSTGYVFRDGEWKVEIERTPTS